MPAYSALDCPAFCATSVAIGEPGAPEMPLLLASTTTILQRFFKALPNPLALAEGMGANSATKAKAQTTDFIVK